MCGAGIQTSTNALEIYFAKGKDVSLCDGSWAEWATKVPDLIVTEKKDQTLGLMDFTQQLQTNA